MKNSLLLFILVIATSAFAQKKSTEQELKEIVQEYNMSKKEMLSDLMNLQGDKATEFWKIYGEYEADRQVLAKNKFDRIVDYAAHYEGMTAEKADELVNAALDANVAYEKLNRKYYNKVKNAIGALDAAKFTQFETYLQGEIQSQIQAELPFIGQMEDSKKKKM